MGMSVIETKKLHKKLGSRIKEIQDVHARFTVERKNGFGDFKRFFQWYKSKPRKCFYCETKEEVTRELFEKGLLRSKKPAWTGKLEVERKDGAEYSERNCVLCCPLCNNAKSDLISSSDFKSYISNGIREYQKALSNK